MKILIVYAHPEPASFNGALKDLAVKTLADAGHEVRVSDLYAQKFEAAGGPDDFVERADLATFHYQREQMRAAFTPELKAEMNKLAWADFVIFQFPLWWFSLPAILKGWVDRVFAMGFAYGPMQTYDSGPFRGKRAMLSFTTGGPARSYEPGGRNGNMDDLILHIQRGMLYFVGMEVLPPFIAYGASRCTDEERAAYLDAYRERLLSIDSTTPIFAPASRPAGQQ